MSRPKRESAACSCMGGISRAGLLSSCSGARRRQLGGTARSPPPTQPTPLHHPALGRNSASKVISMDYVAAQAAHPQLRCPPAPRRTVVRGRGPSMVPLSRRALTSMTQPCARGQLPRSCASSAPPRPPLLPRTTWSHAMLWHHKTDSAKAAAAAAQGAGADRHSWRRTKLPGAASAAVRPPPNNPVRLLCSAAKRQRRRERS